MKTKKKLEREFMRKLKGEVIKYVMVEDVGDYYMFKVSENDFSYYEVFRKLRTQNGRETFPKDYDFPHAAYATENLTEAYRVLSQLRNNGEITEHYEVNFDKGNLGEDKYLYKVRKEVARVVKDFVQWKFKFTSNKYISQNRIKKSKKLKFDNTLDLIPESMHKWGKSEFFDLEYSLFGFFRNRKHDYCPLSIKLDNPDRNHKQCHIQLATSKKGNFITSRALMIAIGEIGFKDRKHIIHHKDGDVYDNHLSNLDKLKCVTHSREHFSGRFGYRAYKDMYERYVKGEKLISIAASYDTSPQNIVNFLFKKMKTDDDLNKMREENKELVEQVKKAKRMRKKNLKPELLKFFKENREYKNKLTKERFVVNNIVEVDDNTIKFDTKKGENVVVNLNELGNFNKSYKRASYVQKQKDTQDA